MRTGVRVDSLLADQLLRRYYPQGMDRGLLERQLRDTVLTTLDLDEVAEMDLEEMATFALKHGIEQESRLQDAAEEPANEEPAEAGPADGERAPGGVTILIEGMGVEAKVVLHPPKNGGPAPGEREICKALADNGIVSGIKSEFITRLADRPIYGRKFKIAEGKLPVDGQDGQAIFHFDTSIDLTPNVAKDGTADYKSLDYVKNVKQGELLCELVPPTQGQDGFGIHGEVLPGKAGKPVEVTGGSNTTMSQDKTQILAACDGQAYLKGNKVMVSRVLLVDRVDASTGNILFVGTVQVRGDVASGYTVRAGGDIIVGGIVDGATLVAGGNIVLVGGVKGRDMGLLDAGNSVRTLFIENATVRAKKGVYADSILNSTVECGELVSLSGKTGRLIGGKCSAGHSVRAIQIGNEANIATTVCLKDIEVFSTRQAQVLLKITQYRQAIEGMTQIVELAASAGRDTRFQIVLARIVITKQRMEQAIAGLEKTVISKQNQSFVRTVVVRELLYPNTTLEIDGAVYRTTSIRRNVEAVKHRSGIMLQTGLN